MLLEGALRDRAIEVLAELGQAIAADDAELDHSLVDGNTGLAVFLAYLAAARSDPLLAAAAEDRLDRAIAAAVEQPGSVALFRGVTGVGWALAHLPGRVLPASDGDPAAGLDDLVVEYLERLPAHTTYELMFGLVGLGIYALERTPGDFATATLAHIVARLDDLADKSSDGATWFTPPELLNVEARRMFPRGEHNLGLAHGVPGVIAFLAKAPGTQAERLLEAAVRWLRARRLPGGGYPGRLGPGDVPAPARLAWCYGDVGVAVALLGAARRLREPEWEAEARALALAAARRGPEEAAVVDACFCHGAAGLGHMFGFLHRGLGEEPLREAAVRWIGHALDLREPGTGIAGFRTWDPVAGMPETIPGLLLGGAGIGLALTAAAYDLEPAWERVFLL